MILLDFESRSRVPIKQWGGRRYWEEPFSEALCCSWYDVSDGRRGTWLPGELWPHRGRVLAAHNMHGFDRFACDRYEFGAAGYVDTSQFARKAGLPGALDELGTRWYDTPKDREGSRFVRGLSTVRKPPKRDPNYVDSETWKRMTVLQKAAVGIQKSITNEDLDRVVAYCESDVEIMRKAWPALEEWATVDADVEELDALINDRGIHFDTELASALLELDDRIAEREIDRAARALGWGHDTTEKAARSPKQFCEITGAPNAQKGTVDALDHPLARVRRAITTITSGKLIAGFTLAGNDSRLRDIHRYYGAHTGRWSGRGLQTQNLPRPPKRLEDADIDAYVARALALDDLDSEEVSFLIRPTLTASPGNVLVVRDFSSVEAVATAWAAGDDDALAVFASDADVYKVTASRIFGVRYDAVTKAQRQIGKCAELACGYQGGPGAFESIAAIYQLDLTGVDTREIVKAWRKIHKPIVDLWYACQRAFRYVVERGGSRRVSCFEFCPSDDVDSVACFLPSGRPIVYPGARLTSDGSLAFDGARHTDHTYGGKLVENAIQGLCRDLLADALLRAEAAGLNPVMHVHDEIVCDVPRDAAADAAGELQHIMTTPPEWAADFPLGADGYEKERYRK